MKKKEILSILRSNNFEIKKKVFGKYDFEVITENNVYALKIVNLTSNHMVTVNSRTMWEIKRGKISGLKFQALDKSLLNIKDFMEKEKRIVMFSEKPYKIMKHINESDIVDVSSEEIINNTLLTSNIDRVVDYIK